MHFWLKQELEKYVSFNDEEWDFFKSFGKNIKLKSKDIFFRAGEVANKIGFLREGVLRACQENKNGEIVTSYFYHLPHHNIVTLQTSFALKIPSEHTVEAVSDCEIFYIDGRDLKKCLEKFPIFEKLVRKIAEKHYMDSSKRINDFQTKDAKELYSEFLNESGGIVSKVPQYMIASYLGMSQYTLSKLKK